MVASAAPYGMIPVRNQGAGYNTQGFETYPIADAYATAIYYGDVVKIASDGTIQKDTGTSTLTPFGIFLGCRYIEPATGYVLDSNYWPASLTTGYTPECKVMTFPWGEFQIQANGSVTQANVGNNAAIIQTAGSSIFGRSRNALSASSINTTSSLPLRILRIVQNPNNASGDAFTDVLVVFNNNQQLFTATGV
jgi:hypothetical protein